MVYPSSSFTKPFMDTVVISSPKEIRSTRFSTLLTAFAKLTLIDVVGFDSIFLITFSTACSTVISIDISVASSSSTSDISLNSSS